MKHIKRISALLLAAMMLLSLCACGSTGNRTQAKGAAQTSSAYSSYDVADYAMEEAMMADGDMAYGFSAVPTPDYRWWGGEADNSGYRLYCLLYNANINPKSVLATYILTLDPYPESTSHIY